MKKTLFFLVFVSVFAISTQAQVTIGSGILPQKGALLDIKTQNADANNLTSTSGGIVLPRVKLVNVNTLEPFIAANDPNLNALKRSHVGLIVYNLTETAPFVSGLYVWNGSEWLRSGSGGGSASVGARNGLHIVSSQNGDVVKLGGSLTKETAITQSDRNMGFVTGASGEWRVNENDFIVFGNNNVSIGESSVPENTRLVVGGNTNVDGRVSVAGNTVLQNNTTIDGSFRYNYDGGNYSGRYLSAVDNDGTAHWVVPRIGEAATVTGNAVSSGALEFEFNSTNQFAPTQNILLPPGKWLVKFTFLMRRATTTSTHTKCWVTLGFSRRVAFATPASTAVNATATAYEPFDRYRDRDNPAWPVFVEAVLTSGFDFTAVTGEVVIDNFAAPGAINPATGLVYPANGFNAAGASRFDLTVIKNGEGLNPRGNPSWNWTTGAAAANRLRLNGSATENVIVAIKLD